MSSDLEYQITTIKARIDIARRARMRAEADRDAAQERAQVVREQLRAGFGVSTVEQANAKLVELEAALAAAVAALRADLDEIGA